MRRPVEGVYLVLDVGVCQAAGHRPEQVAVAAVGAGVRTVQVRAKHVGVREQVAVTVAVARALGPSPAAVLVVDDRVDVALAARARGARVDGVHVGQHDLDVADVRALVGADALVGVSAAHPHEVRAARGADYVGSGPVRSTPTKPDAGPPLGTAGLVAAVHASALPVVAIGGLGVDDAGPLRRAGVHAMAVVGAVCAAPDPGAAASALVAAWDRAAAPAVVR